MTEQFALHSRTILIDPTNSDKVDGKPGGTFYIRCKYWNLPMTGIASVTGSAANQQERRRKDSMGSIGFVKLEHFPEYLTHWHIVYSLDFKNDRNQRFKLLTQFRNIKKTMMGAIRKTQRIWIVLMNTVFKLKDFYHNLQWLNQIFIYFRYFCNLVVDLRISKLQIYG